jgi:hypothetical protein
MAMTRRERLILICTGAACALFVGDRYALSPYVEASRKADEDLKAVTVQKETADMTFDRRKKLDREWRSMLNGGLKSDAGDAEQQLYESVQDWAREAGVSVSNTDPQRVARNDRTQIVRLRVTGTGTTAAFARLLYKLEKSTLPVRVDEFTLSSRNQGNDDLSVSMWVSTIWVRPPSPDDARRPAAPRRTPAAGTEDL